MKNPARLPALFLAAFALANAQPQTPKPGYSVVVEISYDEQGVPEREEIYKSDDPTGDHVLQQIALNMAAQDRQPAKLVDGKPVKFKARRPFNFPVEGDQGPAANADRPVLRSGNQVLPVYPAALLAQDVNGGAIVQLVIRADGTVRAVQTLKWSHPEFGKAAEEALRQWVFNPREGPGMPAESRWHVAVGFSTKGQPVDIQWRLAPRPAIGGIIIGQLPPAALPPGAAPMEIEKPAAPAPGK